jgi:hypothetical protein
MKTIEFTGSGTGAVANVYPLGALGPDFGSVMLNSYSQPQVLTLTNTGNDSMDLGKVQIAPGFAQTNSCPALLAPQASCKFWLSAKPDHVGRYNGLLTFTDFAAGTRQLVLYATGLDFQVSITRPSRSQRNATDLIPSGQSGAYKVTLDPSGLFAATVLLGCSGAPAGVNCQVQPSIVNLNGAPMDINVVVAVAADASPRGRALRLRKAALSKSTQSKSFNLKVTATIGDATRSVDLPITVGEK